MNDRSARFPNPKQYPPQNDLDIVVKVFDRQDREIASFEESYLRWFPMTYEQRLAHARETCKLKNAAHVRWAYQSDEGFLRKGGPAKKVKSVIVAGFDRDGKRLCEMTITKKEWADMDRELTLRLLSSMATENVAYYQWCYLE